MAKYKIKKNIRFNFDVKYKLRTSFFYLGLLLQCIYMMLYITIYNVPFSTFFAVTIFGLFLITILNTSYTKNEIMLLGLLTAIATGCYFITHDTLIFRILFMCFAAKSIDKKELIDFITKCYITMFVMIPLISLFRGNEYIYSDESYGVGRTLARRYMFGFDGPNRLGVIWVCCMSMIMIQRGKKDIGQDCILGVISLVLYYLTRSRSMILVCLVILAMPYFIQLFGKWRFLFFNRLFIVAVLFIFVGITIYFARNGVDRENIYNIILNNRLVHFQDVVGNEKFTLFGSTSDFGKYVGLDNSYFLNFYKRGIFLSAIYIIAIFRLGMVIVKRKNLIQLSVLVGFITLAFVQDVIQHPFINLVYFIIMFNFVNDGDQFRKDNGDTLRI